jgi:hypothetical protein
MLLYALAGAAGYLATPTVALAIFVVLPIYGVTSHGARRPVAPPPPVLTLDRIGAGGPAA